MSDISKFTKMLQTGIYPKYPEETVLLFRYSTRQRNFALYVTHMFLFSHVQLIGFTTLFTEEASFLFEYFATVYKLSILGNGNAAQCLFPLNGPGKLSLPANCLARSLHHPSFSPWRKAFEASRQVPCLRSLQYPDCIFILNSKAGLSAFLCVQIFSIFLKLLQFFCVTIGKPVHHCFKIRNNHFSVTIEIGIIFTCKYFIFGLNTTCLSQSHFRNFLACSISNIIQGLLYTKGTGLNSDGVPHLDPCAVFSSRQKY